MSPWLFNVYMNAVVEEVKRVMRRKGVRFQGEGRKWRLPDILYADDLDFCGESEEDLKAIVGRFVDMCRRRGPKVNAGRSKVILLNGDEELESEVCVDEMRMEHVSEFKYLGCV